MFILVIKSCLFRAALRSLAGKGLTYGSLVCCVFLYFVIFQYGVPGQVWYLIVPIPDLCLPLLSSLPIDTAIWAMIRQNSIGTASANSLESDLGCTSRIYIDNVTLTLYNVTLTSQKPCQRNKKCGCSKTNGYATFTLCPRRPRQSKFRPPWAKRGDRNTTYIFVRERGRQT